MNVHELFNLQGKTAIVTGGYKGLGFMMAEGLAEAGANLVICARNLKGCEEAAEQLRKTGVRCLPLACDVSSEEDVIKMSQDAISAFGKIDILINNAGVAPGGPLEKTSVKKWQTLFSINVMGTFLCTREIGKHMIKNSGGKIINVGSVAGIASVDPELAEAVAYGASKGAVVSFTKGLAREWSKYNITVNAIIPGYFGTELADYLIEHRWEQLMRAIHLKRTGKKDDMKGLAVFLAADASNYITGQILPVDGGVTA
jgi:NAD(P)-dependent dehydrogenase (short-subunit alcohol dehydrogenase family)